MCVCDALDVGLDVGQQYLCTIWVIRSQGTQAGYGYHHFRVCRSAIGICILGFGRTSHMVA